MRRETDKEEDQQSRAGGVRMGCRKAGDGSVVLSAAHIPKHFVAFTPSRDKTSVEVVGVSMGGFTSPVIV